MTVVVGDPIHFDDLLNMEDAHVSRGKLYDDVSSRIGHRLRQLKVQVDRLALEQANQIHNHPVQSSEQTAGILQHVDWELFGIGSYFSTKDDSSSMQESQIQLKLDDNYTPGPASSLGQTKSDSDSQELGSRNWYFRMGLSNEGGIVSRIRGYMDPTEIMSFAARGLFMNLRSKEICASC